MQEEDIEKAAENEIGVVNSSEKGILPVIIESLIN
jgi:hypothetical protein